MATTGMRDQDRLEGSSNYVIWKARMSLMLNEYGLKLYIDNVVVVPQDADQIKEYWKELAKLKLILDGVWDHIVSHIVGKDIAKVMRDSLATLYQGTSE